ncbi:Sushi, von Willebrand factor type A, EGF and pentraxin domain-containing protein 1 [Ilyodon furcidens]|uniref:Sushi, von Willebrand factor type A, EGF and pentraxin domain-containing protein 1 n=1 Tax=Ilyodon furcidens TaxID=33524 RepID=A0ABV0SL11_9TELE
MTCQVVYCPAQTPPENGFFVQNVCNNHFEAACGVRCQPGFELHGTGIRLCQADGSWSGTPASCRVRSCPPLSRPQHGLLRCSDGGASYRTQCQVGCERGYRLEGNSTVTCQANSQWSGPLPRCVGMSLFCGRKVEYPERTLECWDRTPKINAQKSQAGVRTEVLLAERQLP